MLTARIQRAIFTVLGICLATVLVSGNTVSAGAFPSHQTATSDNTPEQRLVDRFAPIAMLKRQSQPCDSSGEPFVPSPVEVVLGDPDVALRRITNDGGDELVMMAPTAADLAGLDDSYFLDFPGNARAPGCVYERHFRERMQDFEPVTYARVVSDGDRLVIQYWFYYPFNDFNNTHESDWEMIQLRFPVGTVEEALSTEPDQVAYAQHGGGELAAWDDPKLRRDGDRPLVYVAAGSHASQFGDEVYLGWGERGAGFGCDDTTGPSERLPLQVMLMPTDTEDATGEFVWLAFKGHWGERQPAMYNGPVGPNAGNKWADPFGWQENLRDSSIAVPAADTFGPGPAGVFCGAVGFGSTLFTRFAVYPELVILVVVALIGGVALLTVLGRGVLAEAWRIYRSSWRLFVALGLVLIPIGLVANGFQYLVVEYPPGRQLYAVMNASPGARLAAALTVGGFQQLVGLILVGPAVVQAVAELERGQSPTFLGVYRHILANLRVLARAVGRTILIIGALALSVIGIPLAVVRAIRWLFVSQAVLFDDATAREALRVSESAVKGRWLYTAGVALFLLLIGVAPGPLVGILTLVLASTSVAFVNALSSLIYAIALPLAVIGLSVLYRQLQGNPITITEPSADSESAFSKEPTVNSQEPSAVSRQPSIMVAACRAGRRGAACRAHARRA